MNLHNKKFINFTIDGKKFCLPVDAEILIQVGKNKSSYKTRNAFRADQIGNAVFTYQCINVGNGYKKRLNIPCIKKNIVDRVLT